MMRAEVRLAWKTQAGHRHSVEGLDNEDAVFVTDEHPSFDALLLVADGMGGHPRPREASEAAVRAARAVLFDRRHLEAARGVSAILDSALAAAHQAVRSLHDRAAGGKQPGTTLSLAALMDGALHVVHIGDGSVFLMRNGQVTALAGGEARRAGNRPEQFLGQDMSPDPERRQLPLAVGDRVLLCTDGLTRYFQEAGAEALERVLGRERVGVQSIAGQLTAHSRATAYDDDTTVAVAEVIALREGAEGSGQTAIPTPAHPHGRQPAEGRMQSVGRTDTPVHPYTHTPIHPHTPSPVPWLVAGAVAGALLVTGGFLAGRYLNEATPSGPAGPGPGARDPAVRQPASPEQLQQLPVGNLVLLDRKGRRAFVVGTRRGDPGSEPVELEGFSVGSDGRLDEAGLWRYNPVLGELSGPGGRRYPVELEPATGSLRILRAGTLLVHSSPPGATVYLDGRRLGPAPLTKPLAAGRYRVRVESRGRASETAVEVPPGGSVSVTLPRP